LSLLGIGYRLARPLLQACDAETAHRVGVAALALTPALRPAPCDASLATSLFGLTFPNPVGLAAGFDKNAQVSNQMLGLGFGFVEVGTTTPRPQTGNPRPRLFRLREDQGVINRMGFNNDGHEAMYRRLMGREARGIVGVNIGANKDAVDRIADYVTGVTRFGPIADYLTINISSPNTPGLRELQSRNELQALLSRLNEARAKLARPVAMVLKISPDLVDRELDDIAASCVGTVDGVIISNTTVSRSLLNSVHAKESGGLSGRPLFDLSTRQLARFYLYTDGKIPLIGVGGICDAETAWTKITAGASLVQLYSALVYEGPGLAKRIVRGIGTMLRTRNIKSVSSVMGSDARRLAYQTGPGT
jgi:dihydroorotate dehydrogenase